MSKNNIKESSASQKIEHDEDDSLTMNTFNIFVLIVSFAIFIACIFLTMVLLSILDFLRIIYHDSNTYSFIMLTVIVIGLWILSIIYGSLFEGKYKVSSNGSIVLNKKQRKSYKGIKIFETKEENNISTVIEILNAYKNYNYSIDLYKYSKKKPEEQKKYGLMALKYAQAINKAEIYTENDGEMKEWGKNNLIKPPQIIVKLSKNDPNILYYKSELLKYNMDFNVEKPFWKF